MLTHIVQSPPLYFLTHFLLKPSRDKMFKTTVTASMWIIAVGRIAKAVFKKQIKTDRFWRAVAESLEKASINCKNNSNGHIFVWMAV